MGNDGVLHVEGLAWQAFLVWGFMDWLYRTPINIIQVGMIIITDPTPDPSPCFLWKSVNKFS